MMSSRRSAPYDRPRVAIHGNFSAGEAANFRRVAAVACQPPGLGQAVGRATAQHMQVRCNDDFFAGRHDASSSRLGAERSGAQSFGMRGNVQTIDFRRFAAMQKNSQGGKPPMRRLGAQAIFKFLPTSPAARNARSRGDTKKSNQKYPNRHSTRCRFDKGAGNPGAFFRPLIRSKFSKIKL